jgi:hypothetical protein
METGDYWPAALIGAMKSHGMKLNKLIPASVLEYNRATNMATVQPQMMILDVSDNTRSRNPIGDVPVLSLGGGGFHISFPLQQGSFGWILAADRDVSQFVENLQQSPPNTLRSHSFADSWFIPDVFRQYTINSSDANAMVIQSTDGTTRISISEGQVNIFAPTSAMITTPTATFSNNVVILGNLQVDENLTVTGLTEVNGGFNATGTGGDQSCTLPQSTTIGGIAVYGHGHIQDGTSGRTSGGMVS